MAIDKNKRRQGHGKKMMNFVERWARERRYETLVLRAADPIPVKFYQNIGYRLLEGGGTLDPDTIRYCIRERKYFSKNIQNERSIG